MRGPLVVFGFALVIAVACSNPVDNDPLASLGGDVRSIDIDHVIATDWEAESIESDGEVLFTFEDFEEDRPYTLIFSEDGRFGGRTFFNKYWGSFSFSDQALSFSGADQTFVGGPEEMIEREQIYLGTFPKVDASGMEGERLILHSSEKDRTISFLPSE